LATLFATWAVEIDVPAVVERGGYERVDLGVDSHLDAQIRDSGQDCLKLDLIRLDGWFVSPHAHFKAGGFPGPQEKSEEGATKQA
jgi:hypothetical protein